MHISKNKNLFALIYQIIMKADAYVFLRKLTVGGMAAGEKAASSNQRWEVVCSETLGKILYSQSGPKGNCGAIDSLSYKTNVRPPFQPINNTVYRKQWINELFKID